ncbi:hypothetical protein ABZ208_32940 [Streptomyces sp. NPDC006208]|uniref:hypothetical protein n=1 Tax=Streptomyces sp. NPDC006208 TaxID=3156734 RepID=UPI0033B474F8
MALPKDAHPLLVSQHTHRPQAPQVCGTLLPRQRARSRAAGADGSSPVSAFSVLHRLLEAAQCLVEAMADLLAIRLLGRKLHGEAAGIGGLAWAHVQPPVTVVRPRRTHSRLLPSSTTVGHASLIASCSGASAGSMWAVTVTLPPS